MPSVRRTRRAAFCGQQELVTEYTTIPSHPSSQYLQSASREANSPDLNAGNPHVIWSPATVTQPQPPISRQRGPDRPSTKSTWKPFKSSHSTLLSLTCRSSCATLTYGVSRFQPSPPILTNAVVVAIEPRSPHSPVQPIDNLSRIYTVSIALPVWLHKSHAVGSYSFNRLDYLAIFRFFDYSYK